MWHTIVFLALLAPTILAIIVPIVTRYQDRQWRKAMNKALEKRVSSINSIKQSLDNKLQHLQALIDGGFITENEAITELAKEFQLKAHNMGVKPHTSPWRYPYNFSVN